MYHNQFQQVQQKINAVQQMVSSVRQSEQTNQQRLQQLAQDEAYAAQQLQRVQQLCQELSSNIQNITSNQSYSGITSNQGYTTPSEIAHFGSTQLGGYTTAGTPGSQSYQGTGIFDPTAMNVGNFQGNLPTSANLSSISTMSPDTYLASREQFSGSNVNMGQIGQQAGISNSGINKSFNQ
ncbi:MAG: hypothetical protein CVU87_10080 [Firmicutes bacterium HGW-Firmicutes-12]|jgi:hypothetical protein|nr:MAG: hypothetical protein CVU87_10080 [Firmicutes bacterium HGW-Firmicutes-12]